MTEEPMGLSSPTDEVSRVELLLAIARMKGSLLSAKDIDELTSLLPKGFELGSTWTRIPSLDSRYELQGGLLLEKHVKNSQACNETLEDSNQRRARAERYIEYAREFSLLSGKKWIRVLSIAGSTSYKSTSENDDIDIFCITEKSSLWIYLTKALLLARVFKLVRPRSPRFCFSYVLDEEYARRLFASPNDALFARDALTAQVLHGSLFYESLLQKGKWLSDYFPKLHKMRKSQHVETLEEAGVTRPSVSRQALNHFLFLTVGNYVRLKSTLLNRKLRKTGRPNSFFTIINGRDHCIFESQEYQELRRMYGKFKPHSVEHQTIKEPEYSTGAMRQHAEVATEPLKLKLLTAGRRTGLPHIVELRFARSKEAFFVLAGDRSSDWVLNALTGTPRVRIGQMVYPIIVHEATLQERAQTLQQFLKRYGSRIVDTWYAHAELCLKMQPTGPPTHRNAVRGEMDTQLDFESWKSIGNDYYATVQEAFDSASEEYDFTISHNFINTWIRKRSIKELLRLVKPDDVLLEIGCGTGAEAIQISKSVRQIIATDISQGMLRLLRQKIRAKQLEGILPVQARAASISTIAPLLDGGKVRVAYSFNGALNLEPDIDKFPQELSKVVDRGGYFVCSVRNIFCLSETIAHAAVLQVDKIAPRRKQPTMVSVGGIDIPAFYYSTTLMSRLFKPYFKLRKLIGLPAFLPPAYLNDYCIRFKPATSLLESLETVLAERFPFNRLSDQTLFVFQRR